MRLLRQVIKPSLSQNWCFLVSTISVKSSLGYDQKQEALDLVSMIKS